MVSDRIAAALRSRGISCDVSPNSAKIGKQIKYADRLGIPYVWFPAEPGGAGPVPGHDQIKNIITGEQESADLSSWAPAPDYARQDITAGN